MQDVFLLVFMIKWLCDKHSHSLFLLTRTDLFLFEYICILHTTRINL